MKKYPGSTSEGGTHRLEKMDANEAIRENLKYSLLELSRLKNSDRNELRILYHIIMAQKLICESRAGCRSDWVTDILLRIDKRMKVGMERYGHGIILESDTRTWGTRENSWLEMCEEELLDGMVYTISEMLRNE